MAKFPEKLNAKLQQRVAENALRSLKPQSGLVDFSSNDYLGFARDYVLKNAVETYLHDGPENGATGSRLLTGNHGFYKNLEDKLCVCHKAEAALVFNSGYDANLGFFSSVPQRNDLIFYDELCHASIRDGIRLSNAKSFKFRHNDLNDLKKVVDRNSKKDNLDEIYVVTESVFSMDGDCPDLKELAKYCSENNLNLVVDEAHAVGVFQNGLVNMLKLEDLVFARIVTFGKALGAHGAAILSSEQLKTYLVNFARSLIYTTALPPHSLYLVHSGYGILQHKTGAKAMYILRKNIEFFKSQVESKGLNPYFGESESAIHCCKIEGNRATKAISETLEKEGFDVRPILAPTVPKGDERLRFCLHSFNTEKQMVRVLELLKKEL